MERITQKRDGAAHGVDATASETLPDGGYAGAAVERLAQYEDALELAEQQWRSASDKLDALKAQGKSRSATAQQLLAQKVTFATMLHAFGVEDA